MFFEPRHVLSAVPSLPEVRSAELGILIAQRDLKIARSAYYPTLYLSGGYGSTYSDARQKVFINPDGTYRYEAYHFLQQYRDNASSFISLALTIPILTRMNSRNNVLRKKLEIQRADYALKTIEKQAKKEIIEAHVDQRTAWEKFHTSRKFVEYAEEAVRQMERKYNLGAASIFEYNITMNTLLEARTELIKAKYEYIFKSQIIKYYLEL